MPKRSVTTTEIPGHVRPKYPVSAGLTRKECAEHLQKHFWKVKFWNGANAVVSAGGHASIEQLVAYIRDQEPPPRPEERVSSLDPRLRGSASPVGRYAARPLQSGDARRICSTGGAATETVRPVLGDWHPLAVTAPSRPRRFAHYLCQYTRSSNFLHCGFGPTHEVTNGKDIRGCSSSNCEAPGASSRPSQEGNTRCGRKDSRSRETIRAHSRRHLQSNLVGCSHKRDCGPQPPNHRPLEGNESAYLELKAIGRRCVKIRQDTYDPN